MEKFHLDKAESVSKTFRLPVDLVDRLSQLAHDKNISLNQLVIKCCKYAINNLDEEPTGRDS